MNSSFILLPNTIIYRKNVEKAIKKDGHVYFGSGPMEFSLIDASQPLTVVDPENLKLYRFIIKRTDYPFKSQRAYLAFLESEIDDAVLFGEIKAASLTKLEDPRGQDRGVLRVLRLIASK